MTPYRFLRAARIDLREALTYYDRQSLDLGSRFFDAFEAGVRRIRQYPEIGSPLRQKVRKFVLDTFPYSILYVYAGDEIVIVAVAGQARRAGYWRARLRNLGSS